MMKRTSSVKTRSIAAHTAMRDSTSQKSQDAVRVPSTSLNDSNARSHIPGGDKAINARPTTGIAGRGVMGQGFNDSNSRSQIQSPR